MEQETRRYRRYSPKEKEAFVQKHLANLNSGMSAAESARQLDVNAMSLDKWINEKNGVISTPAAPKKKKHTMLTMPLNPPTPTQQSGKVMVILGEPDSVQQMLAAALEKLG